LLSSLFSPLLQDLEDCDLHYFFLHALVNAKFINSG
jgi:hypothetical protein